MITIYSKENCPNCKATADICRNLGLDYEFLKLDIDYTRDELVAICPEPVRSVPQIFVDGEYLGDFTKFKQKFVDKV